MFPSLFDRIVDVGRIIFSKTYQEFVTMTTLADLARICIHTYPDGGQDVPDGYVRVTGKPRWSLLYHTASRTAVVAFKGTTWGDFLDMQQSLRVVTATFDYACATITTSSEAYEAVRTFVATGCVDRVLYTGHSMGARQCMHAYHTLLQSRPTTEHACVGFATLTTPVERGAGLAVTVPPVGVIPRILHVCVRGDPVSSWAETLNGSAVFLPCSDKETALQRHSILRMPARVATLSELPRNYVRPMAQCRIRGVKCAGKRVSVRIR